MTKLETFIRKIINAIINKKPTTIKFEGKTFRITKSMINSYSHHSINNIDDGLIRRIKSEKEGGILPLLPLIFSGLAATGALAGGAAGIAKAVNDKSATDKEHREDNRHNKELEKIARGSGVSDLVGTIKDFGHNFSKETKKSVKEGLLKLADNIQIQKQGNGLFLSPYPTKGNGLYLSPHP